MRVLCICMALYLHITFDMNITYISILWFALQHLFLCGNGTMRIQQIYIPLEGRYPILYEFEASTIQVTRDSKGHWHVNIGEKR